MQENKMLNDIQERLNAKTIHEVRRIARAVGAHSESSQKSSIMQAILAVAQGIVLPQPPSKRGAPPKSEETDERLVADIKICCEYCLALKSGEQGERQFLTVNDSGYGRRFSELTHVYPEKRISLSSERGQTDLRIIDLFVPVVLGQRVLISSDSNSGKTELIKSIAQGICRVYGDIKVIVLLLNARPEEVTDFKRTIKGAELFCSAFDVPAQNQVTNALRAFDCAKKYVENGYDAVVLADGLFSGYIGAEQVKQMLYCACNAEEGGSLTVVAALPKNTANFGDYSATASSEIVLSSELSRARIYPAIDVKKSYMGRESVHLTADELKVTNALRAKYSAEEIINIFKNTESNEEILLKYKNG